jgi:hypothetical protein
LPIIPIAPRFVCTTIQGTANKSSRNQKTLSSAYYFSKYK